MELTQLEDAFVDIGGHFLRSAFDLREKMSEIKAIIFDWDGVFNGGEKDASGSSKYSVVDSTGFDRLRFGFFLAHNRMLTTAIFSESENPICSQWCRNEHINNMYFNTTDKVKALNHFCTEHNILPSEIIYVYDDIADLPVAVKVGMRLSVGRLSSPLFLEYIERNKLVDYISSCQGNEHAVREISELLLALLDQHFNVMNHTGDYEIDYQDYLGRKLSISTSENKVVGKAGLESHV